MGKKLFKNAFVVSMSSDETVYDGGSVEIIDDLIHRVGFFDHDSDDCYNEIIDLDGCYLLPGFVNTHVHTSQQISRGVGDDVDFLTWLHKRMWPFESQLTVDDSYVSTLACCLELIKSGVTSFAEAGGQHVEGMVQAVSESGLRAKLAKSVMDSGTGLPAIWQKDMNEELDEQVDLFHRFHGKSDGRVQIWFGLRTIFNNSDLLIQNTKELADLYKTGIHMHVAEAKSEVEYCQNQFGCTTVKHLEHLGVLGDNLLAVHSVWLDDDEINLFRTHDVKVSHNPASAMRVLGFARIPEMLDREICVSIGTDGASSSNRMDIVDEMWLTSLIHKGRRLDPTVMPSQNILRMATKLGARALLDDKLYGSIEVGKKADLIVIDPRGPSMTPVNDRIAALVTAMRSENIIHNICDGKWIMKNRVILSLDEESILREASERAKSIYARAGISLPNRFPIVTG